MKGGFCEMDERVTDQNSVTALTHALRSRAVKRLPMERVAAHASKCCLERKLCIKIAINLISGPCNYVPFPYQKEAVSHISRRIGKNNGLCDNLKAIIIKNICFQEVYRYKNNNPYLYLQPSISTRQQLWYYNRCCYY